MFLSGELFIFLPSSLFSTLWEPQGRLLLLKSFLLILQLGTIMPNNWIIVRWTTRSIHLLFYWILFENVMSLHRTKATLIGLLEAGRANEWVVTEKLGDALKKAEAAKKANTKSPKRITRLFKLPDRSEFTNTFNLFYYLPLQSLWFKYFLKFCNFFFILTSTDSTHWSWDLERSSSAVDAMISFMERTTTSYTCSCKPWPSSSQDLDMLVQSSPAIKIYQSIHPKNVCISGLCHPTLFDCAYYYFQLI